MPKDIAIKVKADGSQAEQGINSVVKSFLNMHASAVKFVAAGSAVAAVAITAGKKLYEMAQQSAAALDRVDKMSQKIGLSRKGFQEWDYVLAQSGASVEGLQMGIKTLSNAATEAEKGTKQYAAAFEKLGVSVTDSSGKLKDQETLFNEVFSALAEMENATERTALANSLLGKSATELAPALNSGADSIKELRDRSHDLGLVMSDEAVDAGVACGDAIDDMKKAGEALLTRFITPMLPKVTDLALGVADFAGKLSGSKLASSDLTGKLNDLVTANSEYERILQGVKTGQEGFTQAMLDSAAAVSAQALVDLNKTYKGSVADAENTQKAIDGLTKKNKDANEALDNMAARLGVTREELSALRKSGELLTMSLADGQTSGKDLADAFDELTKKANNANEKILANEANQLKMAADRTAYAEALAKAYLEGNDILEIYRDTDSELYNLGKQMIGQIQARTTGIENANKVFGEGIIRGESYASATKLAAERILESGKAADGTALSVENLAYWTQMLKLANDVLNPTTDGAADSTYDIAKAYEEAQKKAKDLATTNELLGKATETAAGQASIYESVISEMIAKEVDPANESLKELLRLFNEASAAAKKNADATNMQGSAVYSVSDALKKAITDANNLMVANRLLGTEEETAAARVNIFETAIRDMVANGVDPANKDLENLIGLYKGASAAAKDAGGESLSFGEKLQKSFDVAFPSTGVKKWAKDAQDIISGTKQFMQDNFGDVISWGKSFYDSMVRLQEEASKQQIKQLEKRMEEEKKLQEKQMKVIQGNYVAQSQGLDKQYDEGLMTYEEYMAAQIKLNDSKIAQEDDAVSKYNELEAKKIAIQNEAEKTSFENTKRQNVAQALIGAAQAIIQCYSSLGPVAGSIAAAGIGTLTAVQIGTIQSQQFTPTALAEGGIVTRPTYALIGEGGEPEAVLPLSKAGQMGFGGQGVITIINNIDGALSSEDVARGIFEAIEQAQRIGALPRWRYA